MNIKKNNKLKKSPLPPALRKPKLASRLQPKQAIQCNNLEKILPPKQCSFFPQQCICPPGPPGPQGPAGPPGPEASLCDCCTSPMQNVLRQLIGQQVILGTVADEPNVPPFLFQVTIDDVDDFLVTVTDPNTNVTNVVAISAVTAVLFLPGPEIELEPPVDFPGECHCVERPMRELMETLITSTVNLRSRQGSFAQDVSIQRVGLGIVYGQLDIGGETIVDIVLSICEIAQVELP